MSIKDVLKNHKIMLSIFFVGISACVIGALLVAIIHINYSWVGRYGRANIGEFSIGTTILFFVLLILWETLFVFLPRIAILSKITNYWWKNKLTEQERHILKHESITDVSLDDQKEGSLGNYMGTIAGALLVLMCLFSIIAMLIIVILDGNWVTPYNSLPYTYYVNAWFAGLAWVSITCLIFGITCSLIWYYRNKR